MNERHSFSSSIGGNGGRTTEKQMAVQCKQVLMHDPGHACVMEVITMIVVSKPWCGALCASWQLADCAHPSYVYKGFAWFT